MPFLIKILKKFVHRISFPTLEIQESRILELFLMSSLKRIHINQILTHNWKSGNPQESQDCCIVFNKVFQGNHIEKAPMESLNQRIEDFGIVSNQILNGIHINQMPFKNMNNGNPGIEDFCNVWN